MFGVNLAIPGEAWLVGTDNDPDYATPSNPSGERWRAFSNEEVVRVEGRYAIEPWPNPRREDLEFLDPESSTLVRVYRAHARRRALPDSAMRSANLICEELLLATQAIMGSLRSRLPAGILPIPEDLELGDGADDDTEEQANGADPVLRQLLKHLSAPLSDPRSAAALVPYLLKVPTEYLDKIKPIDVAKAIDPAAAERIDQLMRRLANTVDMPPEALLGYADVNHWTGWLVDEDGVRTYVEPYTGIYADALTTQYLRPRMLAAGVADVDRWLIWWDPTGCIAHPDEKENALEAHDRDLISDHRTRSALGFSDDDKPDDDELEARRAQRVATTPGFQPGEPRPAGPTNTEPGPPAPAAAIVAASAPRTRSIGHRWADIETRLLRDLILDADAALRRMLERAQARVRSAAQRNGDTRALAAGVSNDDLVARLGPSVVRDVLALGDDDLLAGGLGALESRFLSFTGAARERAIAELRRLGVEPDPDLLAQYEATAEANAQEGAATLSALLTTAAGGLLFAAAGAGSPQPAVGESDPLLAVSPRDVREALTVAGGGTHALPDVALESAPELGGGLLAGADFSRFLDGIPEFDGGSFLWTVGAPAHPFEPHQDLDGVEFSSWTDDQLAAPPDEFPFVSFYSPLDHPGCQCTVVPTGTVTVDAEPEPEEGA